MFTVCGELYVTAKRYIVPGLSRKDFFLLVWSGQKFNNNINIIKYNFFLIAEKHIASSVSAS